MKDKLCKKCANSTEYFPSKYFHIHHIIYQPEEVATLCINCHSIITALNTYWVIEINKNKKGFIKKYKRCLTNDERFCLWNFFIKKVPISCTEKMAVYLLKKERVRIKRLVRLKRKELTDKRYLATKYFDYYKPEEAIKNA